MARINIEDQLFSDGRFLGLVSLLGSDELALGKCVKAFRLAQGYFSKGLNIPENIFLASGLEPLITIGLAEKREDGIYVLGSDEQFSWIEQKREAGKKGGVASGISRKKKQNGSESEAEPKQTIKQEASAANPQSQSQSQSQFQTPIDIHTAGARFILNHWNSKKIIEHKSNEKIIEKIRKKLKGTDRDLNDFYKAIDNYARVIHDSRCYFSYKWNLVEFLSRENASKFYPGEFIFENFLSGKNKSPTNSKEHFNNLRSIDPWEQEHG